LDLGLLDLGLLDLGLLDLGLLDLGLLDLGLLDVGLLDLGRSDLVPSCVVRSNRCCVACCLHRAGRRSPRFPSTIRWSVATNSSVWSHLQLQARHHRGMTNARTVDTSTPSPRKKSNATNPNVSSPPIQSMKESQSVEANPSHDANLPNLPTMALSETAALNAADLQATVCATMADEWVRGGVRHCVVSPGSRSTPMALAFAAEQRLNLHVILDERSASFFALGLAKISQTPVLLLCTSGTAAVEYHAAVAEADLDRVPLIVCTADRPSELHHIGAPQTVDQQFLYGRSTRWFYDTGVPCAANAGAARSIAARSVLEAANSVSGPGPVHLNLPFREPLVGNVRALIDGRAHGEPWHTSVDAITYPSPETVEEVCARISSQRGLIVAGAGCGDSETIHSLAALLGWPVLADVRSGARTPSPTTIGAVDPMLRSAKAAAVLQPEVVIRLGAPWASKVLNQWLADAPQDILIDPFGAWLDPSRVSSLHVHCDPTALCDALVKRLKQKKHVRISSEWLSRWVNAEAAAQRILSNQLVPENLSEPTIARSLHGALPDAAALVVSSSMPIRDVEWFAEPRPGVTVVANRGANGIDGVVSTVLGVAAGHDGPTIGLIGDLAFLHDVGALVVAAQKRVRATFVVVDNEGGGIFEFLPQATGVARDRFELLYGTHQPVHIESVVAGFGVRVETVESVVELLAALASTSKGSTRTPINHDGDVRVLIIRTNRQANVTQHNELNQLVIEAVEKALPDS
jgi:2-succinyl-5-enolpyruvyl-6-hydroxy-3-cyclohexene-1-carboxylate synthase